MSVNLSPPNQLGFPRPLTQIVKRSLLIHNPNPQPVAFKVKTTAPKQYCVRPNQGRVEPGENVEVQSECIHPQLMVKESAGGVKFVLQALSADPPPHAKCKDKFLVQSAFIPPDEEMHSLPEMWAQVERTNKASIHEQKIRCAYLSAEDGASNPNGIPEENEDSMSPIDNRIDESHMANSKGYTQFTTVEERSFDPILFVNGGRTHWVLEEKPKSAFEKPAAPQPISHPRPPISLRKSQSGPSFHFAASVNKDLPKNVALVQPDGQNLVIYQISGIYTQAETDTAGSPISKQLGTLNGGAKDLPSTPQHGLGAGSAALGAGALGAGAAAIGSSQALNASHPSGGVQRELPSLSASDVQSGGAPTNAALERSLNATTSDSEKLRIVLQENESLKSQLNQLQNAAPQASGLRKRGGAGADVIGTGTKTDVATAPGQSAAGVPLEVCAGLVFAVFVLTYLFF